MLRAFWGGARIAPAQTRRSWAWPSWRP